MKLSLVPAFVLGLIALTPLTASAQISPEEHASHHPEEAAADGADSGMGKGPKGMGGMGKGGPPEGAGPDMMGGGGGMMGGGKGGGMMGGGGMGGMMEKMGAPKPKDLYPSLMELPDLPMERRGELEQEAHQRMIAGTRVLSEGFDQLSTSAGSDDFAAMQAATDKIREGLGDFESGLAAHRALREGKAPRNVALQWFKSEMNLSDAAPVASSNAMLWGMTPFHSIVMAILVLFAAAMIWMYFFKMRRAATLLDKLAVAGGGVGSEEVEEPGSQGVREKATVSSSQSPPLPDSPSPTSPSPSSDCCDTDDGCETETAAEEINTGGLLPVAKKKLCRLRVAKIIQETDDVKTFRLVACHGGGIPFSYLPGQFLTFTLPVAEKPIKRSYTISSSPTQGYYCEVTVKREDNGAGSRYLHDHVNVGDTLEVKAPSGRFIFSGKESDQIVLISGGVGITPMMSITRALTDMAWPGEIHFIAACRDPEHFIFESELKRLHDEFDNLHVHVAMSRIEKDANGYTSGRLTKERLAEWVPKIASKRIHICGAPAMMEATKAMLSDLGVSAENIHSENFGSAQKPKAKVVEKPKARQLVATGAKVTFATSNKSTAMGKEETILEASERIGVDIDYSCRVGTCGECRVKLLSGDVSMEVDDGLEPEDKQAGMILACQAKSNQDVSVDA
ncbi:3-ketosteroid-9-alpha-hydroxylase reductase subunit [Stieleria neptunia]|uniref:3-ketosteroid-9-alpha-hydroxylase reductase subunit n=1 Tax=Stieleria neptunia TaxID=2527979 RepID=A0A518I379_9BACT|nr:2Fe-2S iron-sulfur cluster-binding protein [Stieleria neptunia]QDV47516.1 3-ketosteroid-9-alpha-hydroxylase reductase subunit [Stieleria neptunia]